MGSILYAMKKEKKKLLLHVCCAPCSTHVIESLMKEYALTIFFYNPNIFPREEYARRLDTACIVADYYGLIFVDAAYDTESFERAVAGHEDDSEGGRRCELCFNLRLQKTAQAAKMGGYDLFATTLTISPHKDSGKVNVCGSGAGKKFGIPFLEGDFKKHDGFKKSIDLSKKLNLYRQRYCGCVYSSKENRPKPEGRASH